ncbi:linear amide C-N hydrolase [Desulfovibrio litoralis]|uniref:Linear amide C-N hydrolases, choloylglycine hydrolase family n=1 Tax=Desulfovibrio litoralis DSM 11393 TaxID=1121455 RepID=A0A1M7SRX1_9BACT|nr:linear amide C-N hydrolase [Desulfovibrio litoralis]SHN61323.1 Linear amide C-N hydrolases, choloylglycine hydrolase family [Desulfovibrio litoralis DSM 11393]
MLNYNKKILFLFLFAYLLFSNYNALACTDIFLRGKNNLIHARTMEFAIPLASSIFKVEKNTKFQSTNSKNETSLEWKNKYAYIGIDSPVIAYRDPLDGINEEGLSISALWLNNTKFLAKAEDENAIASTHLISYLLGTCKNIPELKNTIQKLKIWGEPLKRLGQIPTVHLACADADGNYIVVEFINGKTKVYDNPYKALTNDPEFLTMKQICATGKGVNSGSRRLIRAAKFAKKQNYNNKIEAQKATEKYFNSIHIPFQFKKTYTQWYVIKDLQDKKLFFYSDGKLNNVYSFKQ